MKFQEENELLNRLLSQPESEWIEFKENNDHYEQIGQTLSALSNSAKLENQPFGYLIFGIEDKSKKVVGTTFKPSEAQLERQEWKMYMRNRFTPPPKFDVLEFETAEGLPVTIIRIPPASEGPLSWMEKDYIRDGSSTVPLSRRRQHEKLLWTAAKPTPFEDRLALDNIPAKDVLKYLNTASYYILCGVEFPKVEAQIIQEFVKAGILVEKSSNNFAITNLGALILAKDIEKFHDIKGKTVRLLTYDQNNNLTKTSEHEGGYGYAVSFAKLIDFIMERVQSNEIIEAAIRTDVKMYPIVALREIIANAFAHQDYTQPGRVTVEIYPNRIEITNPGKPIVDTDLFIVESVTRNEKTAALLKTLNICEQRGSGIRRVFKHVELFQLPAPKFSHTDYNTKVTLYAHKDFGDMEPGDRIRACYQHCCLKYVMDERMTNSTLRERLKIADANSAMASRIIKDTIEAGLIRQENPNASLKYMKYVPKWAKEYQPIPQTQFQEDDTPF